jgi:hypothetical protein
MRIDLVLIMEKKPFNWFSKMPNKCIIAGTVKNIVNALRRGNEVPKHLRQWYVHSLHASNTAFVDSLNAHHWR